MLVQFISFVCVFPIIFHHFCPAKWGGGWPEMRDVGVGMMSKTSLIISPYFSDITCLLISPMYSFRGSTKHQIKMVEGANGGTRSAPRASIHHYYRLLSEGPHIQKLNLSTKKALPWVDSVDQEYCFNIQVTRELTDDDTTVSNIRHC